MMILVCGGFIAAGYLITLGAIRYARRKGLQDIPGHRSLHSASTPRGGGIAIAIPCVALFAFQHLWVLALTSLWVASIGWWDDHRSLGFRFRLLTQACAAALLIAFVSMDSFSTILHWIIAPILALALMWMTNLYNFMDGIDGIAGSEAIFVGMGMGLFSLFQGDGGIALAYFGLSCASVGFLVLNWSPARIFMGDVGSCFLGFSLTGLALIQAERTGYQSLALLLILAGVFIADSTFTLAIRFFRKQKVHQAHRDHAYQHAVLRGFTHAAVVKKVQMINVFWLAPIAAAMAWHPEWSLALIPIAYLPLIGIAVRLQAGWSFNPCPQ